MIEDEEYANFGGDLARARGVAKIRTVTGRAEPESAITERVLTWLNAQPDTFARKRFSSVQGQTGHPDIEGASVGRSIQIEMKRPGQRPTALQLARLRTWQEAGALVGWACSLSDVQQLLEHLDEPRWRNTLTGPGDGIPR